MGEKATDLNSFYKHFLEKTRPLSNACWFYGKKKKKKDKKRKIGKGNKYSIENRLGWKQMWCAVDNYTYMCHTYAKKRKKIRFELWLSNYWQNISFSQNGPKFHLLTKTVILKVQLEIDRPTASMYHINILAGTCKKPTFSILAVVSA